MLLASAINISLSSVLIYTHCTYFHSNRVFNIYINKCTFMKIACNICILYIDNRNTRRETDETSGKRLFYMIYNLQLTDDSSLSRVAIRKIEKEYVIVRENVFTDSLLLVFKGEECTFIFRSENLEGLDCRQINAIRCLSLERCNKNCYISRLFIHVNFCIEREEGKRFNDELYSGYFILEILLER